MKPTRVSTLVASILALATVFCVSIALADDASHLAAAKAALSKIPLPELPAETAKLITQARPKEQKAIAIAAIRAAIERNPVGAPFIVSAVARAVPSLAATAAATAAALEPKQAGLIAKAAAAAAPTKAGEIVLAMCKELPSSYRLVAIGASEAAPAQNEEILVAVSRVIPGLKPYLEQAKKEKTLPDSYASPLVGILQNAETLAASSASGGEVPLVFPPPPTRPPFTPGAGKPGETNRAQTVVVQPGQGRVYSGP